jgi:hypothetical protein
MKKILPLFAFFVVFVSCDSLYIFLNNQKIRCTKHNTIQNDTIFRLEQTIYCNIPNTIDAWSYRMLYLTFLDTNAAKMKKILNLKTDTLIVKTEYRGWSVWDWDEDADYKVKGKIEILQWDTNKIVLKENIFITDYKRREKKKYIGKRNFFYEK